jgi:hypothetical protein
MMAMAGSARSKGLRTADTGRPAAGTDKMGPVQSAGVNPLIDVDLLSGVRNAPGDRFEKHRAPRQNKDVTWTLRSEYP